MALGLGIALGCLTPVLQPFDFTHLLNPLTHHEKPERP